MTEYEKDGKNRKFHGFSFQLAVVQLLTFGFCPWQLKSWSFQLLALGFSSDSDAERARFFEAREKYKNWKLKNKRTPTQHIRDYWEFRFPISRICNYQTKTNRNKSSTSSALVIFELTTKESHQWVINASVQLRVFFFQEKKINIS